MKVGPVFLRVLKCFESKAELGRQVGVERRIIHYWNFQLGYIPPQYALPVSLACQGRVSVMEILSEAQKGVAAHKAKLRLRNEAKAAASAGVE